MTPDQIELALDITGWLVPLIVAVVFHEVAHGWMALQYGDRTARLANRLTLNPIMHAHGVGTFVLPLVLFFLKSPIMFGFARPVPVQFSNLQPRRRGMAMVAFAGPAANFMLAFASVMLLRLEVVVTPEEAPLFYTMLYRSVMINLALAFFNLLPVMPLDGGRIIYSMLPAAKKRPDYNGGNLGYWVIVGLLILPMLGGPNLIAPYILNGSLYFTEGALFLTKGINIVIIPLVVFCVWMLMRPKRRGLKKR